MMRLADCRRANNGMVRGAGQCGRGITGPATPDEADCPGVIARPPRIYLTALVLGAGLHYLWPAPIAASGITGAARYAIGSALVALGVAIMTVAVRQFGRAGTNVETPKPATQLVTDGVFRFSRNPMYVSLTLIHAGIAVAANSMWMLALLIPTLAVMRYGVIGREERYLDRKFGEPYRRYTAAVRRWL